MNGDNPDPCSKKCIFFSCKTNNNKRCRFTQPTNHCTNAKTGYPIQKLIRRIFFIHPTNHCTNSVDPLDSLTHTQKRSARLESCTHSHPE